MDQSPCTFVGCKAFVSAATFFSGGHLIERDYFIQFLSVGLLYSIFLNFCALVLALATMPGFRRFIFIIKQWGINHWCDAVLHQAFIQHA